MRRYFWKYIYDVKWSMSVLQASLTKGPLKHTSPVFPPTGTPATIMLSGELQTQMPQLWAWAQKDVLEVTGNAGFAKIMVKRMCAFAQKGK